MVFNITQIPKIWEMPSFPGPLIERMNDIKVYLRVDTEQVYRMLLAVHSYFYSGILSVTLLAVVVPVTEKIQKHNNDI